MPASIARQRVETKDFTTASGKDRFVLKSYINKVPTLEMGRPHLLSGGTMDGDDRAFDADEYQV